MPDQDYVLDLHSTMILDEYRDNLVAFHKMREVVLDIIKRNLDTNHLIVTALEARVKTEKSLVGKLELKGSKYGSLENITDIVGARVIAFYTDDVDKIAALAQNIFEVNWEHSVDKRKMHQLDSFGYNSLHYICRIPKKLYYDPDYPQINHFYFELQMRTTLQHMWANMYHDIGYKSGVEVPVEYLRSLNRLAGMMELADDEFSRIRTSINDYRREVTNLVANGSFDDVPLNGDTYKSFLNLGPFDKLNKRIAAINQAEIQPASMLPYLSSFKLIGFKTLGDITKMIKNYSQAAYQLAVHQIGGTDLDIISASLAVQDLCIVYILKQGGGVRGLEAFFEDLNGQSPYNKQRAEGLMEKCSKLAFMCKQGK